eukprot:TRINITY_DN1418_c0_g1_i1.p1 TRINITY_DN1418_c0_g1~~TRINITY_DN1418_c0_g1_i1.p1  ORF type:complete len:258 (-),score=69.19 TRINITY_DN1418_c0_g1_i1:293-1066(-)
MKLFGNLFRSSSSETEMQKHPSWATFEPSEMKTFEENVKLIQRMVPMIGTKNDTVELRETLRTLVKENVSLATSIKTYLTQSTNQQADINTIKKQFVQFQTHLRMFEEITQTYRQFEGMFPRPINSIRQQQLPIDFDDERDSLLQAARRQQQLMIESQTIRIIAEERDKEIKELQKTINELANMMQDLAVIVKAQSSIIQTIEDEVSHSYARVEEGTKQLQQAAKSQNSSRKKYIIITALGVIILVVIGVMVFIIIP